MLRTASAEDREILERCDGLTLIGTARLLAADRRRRATASRARPRRRLRRVRRLARRLGAGDAPDAAGRRASPTATCYLFDTFEGMTEPTDADTSPFQRAGRARRGTAAVDGHFGLRRASTRTRSARCCSRPATRPSGSTSCAGPVEETLPAAAPERIALLRLDTDWYESTRHELEHLYPRLSTGGVLIVDDYGHWDGARRAVDEYSRPRSPRCCCTASTTPAGSPSRPERQPPAERRCAPVLERTAPGRGRGSGGATAC